MPIILDVKKTNEEVHRQVGKWLDDPEVYKFVGKLMPLISTVSMRYYCKGAQLRLAGFVDWRNSLLQMMIPDRQVAALIEIQQDTKLKTEQQRVDRFIAATETSRAMYYRIKTKLAVLKKRAAG
ncbi:MAG: hypothetical protein FWD53_13385 [Phycisphaerales bacterium]|nr:hypothetical protein [Phycisphaerales bacterium]